jgi:hypothetical protein
MLTLTKSEQITKTLCGFPLILDGLVIFPVKIKEVVETGEIQYNMYLTLVTNLKETFASLEEQMGEDFKNLSNFEFTSTICSVQQDFERKILEAISFFLKTKVVFDKKEKVFKVYDSTDIIVGELNEQNYDDFIHIIKLQNYLLKREDKPLPSNKKARELAEQREKLRKKVQELKTGDKDKELTFSDYISIVNSKSLNVSIESCLEMTLYAFFDYLERLTLLDSYEIGVKQLLAGAKPNQVKLKHWLSQL